MGYLKHVPRFLSVLIAIGVIMAGIGQAYQEHAELIDLSRVSPRGKLFSIRDQLTQDRKVEPRIFEAQPPVGLTDFPDIASP